MKLRSLATLIRRDLHRTRGALGFGGFGVAVGTAALVFFLGLGLGVREVLLGQVFQIRQIELEPPKSSGGALLDYLTGQGTDVARIDPSTVEKIRQFPEVENVFPKLRIAFPIGARGGKELFGREIGASEATGDGIDDRLMTLVEHSSSKPELIFPMSTFEDPLPKATVKCKEDIDCNAKEYCERASENAEGLCILPIPVVISPYLIEIFDKSIAPAHGLPQVGQLLIAKANDIVFNVRLGESLLGKAKRGQPRTIKARVAGVSPQAVALGLTFPLSVVRRWNAEYANETASNHYTSVVVATKANDAAGSIVADAAKFNLVPHDTSARDVSVMMSSILGLLTLVSVIILIVAGSNIAYTFRTLVVERRAEIALYRAVGASSRDMRLWILSLAAVIGMLGGFVGIVIARLSALGVDRIAAKKLPNFPFKPESFFLFPWWLWGLALLFSMVSACLGAWGSAKRASRVDPVTALSGA